MSEQEPETPAFLGGAGSLFSQVMDAMVPDPDGEVPEENEPPAGEAEATDAPGAPAPEAAGADGAGAGAGAVVAGGEAVAGGDSGEPPAVEGAAAGGAPSDAGVDFSVVREQVAALNTGLEEAFSRQFHDEALKQARESHAKFFEAINKSPRQLVGEEVPQLNGKGGMEMLRDTEDARDWQEAVKQILTEEIRTSAEEAMTENAATIQLLSSAAQLFSDNSDLIPGVKGFDRELADRFAHLAKPYEVRFDGKLSGYAIDVQPLINSLREDLKKNRTTAPPAAAPAAAAPPKRSSPPHRPQTAIRGKAGASGGEVEDFSTLFGTLGLPNIPV